MQLYVLIHFNQRSDFDNVSRRAVLGIYADRDVAYGHGFALCNAATVRDEIFIYDVSEFELDAPPAETKNFSGQHCRAVHAEMERVDAERTKLGLVPCEVKDGPA